MDVQTHDWARTEAAAMFAKAEWHDGRPFATARGIAFAARSTGDGTWHGFPVPWESIPVAVWQNWLARGVVRRRDIKAFFRFSKDDISWALATDLR